jgi:hypothetical protein
MSPYPSTSVLPSSMMPPSSSSSSSGGSSLYHSDPYPFDRNNVIPQNSPVSYHNSRLPTSESSSSSGSFNQDNSRSYNQIPNINYQKQAQHHAVQHVAPPSPVIPPALTSENTRPHPSSMATHSLTVPSTAPMIHSYPHVLPVPASSMSMSKVPSSSDFSTTSPLSSSQSSLASPTSVQTPSSSINSLFDSDTNVRRSIPSSSSLSSSQGVNSLNEFIVRNQHARNFAGEDGEWLSFFSSHDWR